MPLNFYFWSFCISVFFPVPHFFSCLFMYFTFIFFLSKFLLFQKLFHKLIHYLIYNFHCFFLSSPFFFYYHQLKKKKSTFFFLTNVSHCLLLLHSCIFLIFLTFTYYPVYYSLKKKKKKILIATSPTSYFLYSSFICNIQASIHTQSDSEIVSRPLHSKVWSQAILLITCFLFCTVHACTHMHVWDDGAGKEREKDMSECGKKGVRLSHSWVPCHKHIASQWRGKQGQWTGRLPTHTALQGFLHLILPPPLFFLGGGRVKRFLLESAGEGDWKEILPSSSTRSQFLAKTTNVEKIWVYVWRMKQD